MPTRAPKSKPVLLVQDDQLKKLGTHAFAETGMGFYIATSMTGDLYAVLSDGAALPLQADTVFYDLTDLIAGDPVPQSKNYGTVNFTNTFPTRASAGLALLGLNISPHYAGAAGAFPLVASVTLTVTTVFCRYIRSLPDNRYSAAGSLSAKTYLTTRLDSAYANSGFAAVGRFALPMPLPASHVVEYELPAGTLIEVGTVSPLFGQAGGGVEIRLPAAQTAVAIRNTTLPDY
jgi:hypothetical protein